MLWRKNSKKKERPLPLPEEYISSVCEVKTKGNDLIVTGAITDITPDYIEIADRTNAMLVVSLGLTVKINIINNRLGNRVLEGKSYVSTSHFLRVVELRSISNREQRLSFRVRTNIRGKISRVRGGGVPMVVEDLSIGGARLRCSERFVKGDKLFVQFMLANLMMELPIIVRHVKTAENGSVEYYGVEFESLPEAQSDALCAYLFQRQREQIAQSRR
jgi:hypothetical protein